MGSMKRRVLSLCLTALFLAPLLASEDVRDRLSAPEELIIGTWACVVPYPGTGERCVEMIFYADGTCFRLAHENAGDPILENMSLRGTYVVNGDQLTMTYSELWSAGAWEQIEPPTTVFSTIDAVNLDENTWFLDVDFEQDGVVDAFWTLRKQ